MYKWFVFLHLLGIFGFLTAHGVSISVAFALRRERNTDRIQTLLTLSGSAIGILNLSILLLLGTGIAAGFMGQWWGRGWIWVSLGLLLAISIYMAITASGYYGQVRKAVGMAYRGAPKMEGPGGPASPEEIDVLLNKSKPIVLAIIGFGGLAVITWLMLFKPF